MAYKLIALDMDGTLLNSKGSIGEKTLEAIHQAKNQGILVTVSTGRPIQGIDKYNDLLQLEGPVILYNGAMIVHLKTREILFEEKLEMEDARRILELGKQYKTTLCVWSRNQLYVNEMNERVDSYRKLSDVTPVLIQDYDALLQQGITKILWNDEMARIQELQDGLEEIPFHEVTYCKSKPIFLEFFSSKVSKAVAMEKIGALTGILQSEMIGVGDGENDLSMIEYAGLGVAMGNADNEVKEKAVTLSNDCDGIAEVIKKYMIS